MIHSDYNVDYINIPFFYKDIFVYLKELDIQSRCGGVLWNNKQFAIGGQLFYNKEWHAKGIVYIRDLLGNDNKMLTLDSLRIKYNLNRIDIPMYNAVKIKINKWIKNQDNKLFLENLHSRF